MLDDSLATARAILVGGAVLTMLVAAALGQWIVAGILAVGVAAHTVHILQHRRGEQARLGDTGPEAPVET